MLDISRKDLEIRILGTIIANSIPPYYEGFGLAIKTIRPIDFSSEETREVYIAISRLVSSRLPILLHSVVAETNGHEKVAIQAFNVSKTKMSEACNLQIWLDGLKELNVKTNYIEVIENAVSEVKNGKDPLVVDSSIRPLVGQVFANQNTIEFKKADEICSNLMTMLKDIWTGNAKILPAIPTTIRRLSDLLGGGWWRGKANIIGGRPASGKTSIAEQEAVSVAMNGEPVVFASVEMEPWEHILRMAIRISSDSARISHREILKEQFIDNPSLPVLVESIDVIKNLPIFFASGSHDYDSIMVGIRRAIDSCGKPAMIVVDYIQKFDEKQNSKNYNRVKEIGKMAIGFEDIAREHEAALLLLSQLRRKETKSVAETKPSMDDLRESGELEQMAVTITLCHKPQEKDLSGVTKGELIVAKSRNGVSGQIDAEFDGPAISWRESNKDNSCPF